MAEALDSLGQAPQETAQSPPEEGGETGDSGQSQADQPPPEPADAQEQPGEGEQPGAGDGAGEGDGANQPTEEERLAVEGQPLELESDPTLEERVLQPAELDAKAGQELTEDSPFARESGNPATDLGPDKLTYPWARRELIRRYFTP